MSADNMIKTKLLLCLLSAAILCSCAHKKPEPTTIVRLAVLNGVRDYEVPVEGMVTNKGWMLSNRHSYLSPNTGVQLAEVLTSEFDRIPGVEAWPREDFQIYMAQKERLLQRNYPGLTPVQRKDVLDRQDPIDYGKSLGVDYVMRPEIAYASTVANRPFGWWYSTLEARVEMWDVEAGEMVWSYDFDDTDNFDSQIALMEEMARQASRDARKKSAFRIY